MADAKPAPSAPRKFWHDAWVMEAPQGTHRVGAVLAGLAAEEIGSVQLPKLGEVVYQGLPMASVKTSAGQTRLVCAPITGVVESVNQRLADRVSAVVEDPCRTGWLAEINATRSDVELSSLVTRRVLVLAADTTVADGHVQR